MCKSSRWIRSNWMILAVTAYIVQCVSTLCDVYTWLSIKMVLHNHIADKIWANDRKSTANWKDDDDVGLIYRIQLRANIENVIINIYAAIELDTYYDYYYEYELCAEWCLLHGLLTLSSLSISHSRNWATFTKLHFFHSNRLPLYSVFCCRATVFVKQTRNSNKFSFR